MNKWTKITNKKGQVFWRDNQTKLLWSPPLKDEYTFDAAMAIPQNALVAELGKFKGRTWWIPTRNEIAVAIANGLLEQIPEMESFWSASVVSNGRFYAWLFYESVGLVDNGYRYFVNGVRCVGRP